MPDFEALAFIPCLLAEQENRVSTWPQTFSDLNLVSSALAAAFGEVHDDIYFTREVNRYSRRASQSCRRGHEFLGGVCGWTASGFGFRSGATSYC